MSSPNTDPTSHVAGLTHNQIINTNERKTLRELHDESGLPPADFVSDWFQSRSAQAGGVFYFSWD